MTEMRNNKCRLSIMTAIKSAVDRFKIQFPNC